MHDNTVSAIFFGFVVLFLIGLGIWAGSSSYHKDTFKCTNACGGAHSIEFNNDCYCQLEPRHEP
jgi:hypothetical protein